MGRREDSAGPGHSFRRLWIHSFPTSDLSSVLASRPQVAVRCLQWSRPEVMTRAGCAVPSPGFCSSPSVLPLASPPLPQRPGPPPRRQVQWPLVSQPSRPPPLLSHISGASSSPITHDAVTPLRGPWENRWLPRIRNEEDYLQRGLLTKWAEPRGLREPAEESSLQDQRTGDSHQPQG